MKYLSLFSGIGGFELGIQQAYEITRDSNVPKVGGGEEVAEREREEREGLHPVSSKRAVSSKDRDNELPNTGSNEGQPHCIGYSEIDKYATEVYQKHFPKHKAYGDITKINERDLPDFDLLVGGFPCQSFSIAGKRKGFEDTRGTLFFEIARIVREKQPRLLLLENVKGLLSHDKGNTFYTIISTLDELGYDCQWQVLNSKNHGVPQNRERVFIVGHLRGTPRPEVFPFGSTSETYIAEYPTFCGSSQKNAAVMKGQVPCLSTAMGSGGGQIPMKFEGAKIRRLTPTECARLQGFPDNWHEGLSDTQAYKCYGNAVTVNVIKDIMERLL